MIALDQHHTLRQAEPSDVPRIAEIWLEGVHTAFGDSTIELPPLASIHEHLLQLILQQSTNFKFWLCFDRTGKILGWSTVQPFDTTPLQQARNAIGMISTYIAAESRGLGIGQRLMQFTVDYCREHTAIVYILGLQDRANHASVIMTDRAGFRELAPLPPVSNQAACSIICCVTA